MIYRHSIESFRNARRMLNKPTDALHFSSEINISGQLITIRRWWVKCDWKKWQRMEIIDFPLTETATLTSIYTRHKVFLSPSLWLRKCRQQITFVDILYAEQAQIKSPTTSNGEVLCGKLVCYSKRQEKCFNESQHFAYQFGSLNKHRNIIVKINFLNKWSGITWNIFVVVKIWF